MIPVIIGGVFLVILILLGVMIWFFSSKKQTNKDKNQLPKSSTIVQLGDDCGSLSQCQDGLDCIGGKCIIKNVGHGGECGRYKTCSPDFQCFEDKCIKFNTLDEGEDCLSNSECKDDLNCQEGKCRIRKRIFMEDCSDAMPCQSGLDCLRQSELRDRLPDDSRICIPPSILQDPDAKSRLIKHLTELNQST